MRTRQVEITLGRRSSRCVVVLSRGWEGGSGVEHMFVINRNADGQFMFPNSETVITAVALVPLPVCTGPVHRPCGCAPRSGPWV